MKRREFEELVKRLTKDVIGAECELSPMLTLYCVGLASTLWIKGIYPCKWDSSSPQPQIVSDLNEFKHQMEFCSENGYFDLED